MSVVLVSGGLDSAVLLAHILNTGGAPIHAVTVDYGQRHRRELWFARQLAYYYGATPHDFTLPPELLSGSALTGGAEVPKGLDYRDPGQSATVVPGRNLVLLSLAVATAARVGSPAAYLASHQGDEAVYPDCRKAFVEAASATAQAGYGVRVEAPFLGMTKREIVIRGRSLRVPFEMTWSCYEGGVRPCGRCGACVERTEAMA